LILITAWLIYTTDMSVLPVETKSISFLNVPLLLLVALIPYLLNGVELVNPTLTSAQASGVRDFASTLFAIDLGGILIILAGFAHVISREERRLVSPDLAGLFRSGRNRMAVLAVLMLISVAPQFWQFTIYGVPLRLYMWYLPLISYWLGRVVRPDSRTYTVTRDPVVQAISK